MDEAFELADFLPLSFGNPSDQEYVAFLWDAFESNYREGKYQFAFLAYHMLVMSFVYFEIWQIKENLPREFATAMVGFNKDQESKLLKAKSPFDLAELNESTAFRFLKILGCDNSQVGKYTSLVKMRNDSAHSNGRITLNSAELVEEKLGEAMRAVKEIQSHSTPVVNTCYRQFLLTNLEPDDWEYLDAREQVQETLIYRNYLSNKDLEICRDFDFVGLGLTDSDSVAVAEQLHSVLNEIYDEIAV